MELTLGQEKTLVAGAHGLVGQALVKELGDANGVVLTPSHRELDYTDEVACRTYFQDHRPSIAIFAAARVGGIVANMTAPTEFLVENLKMQMNFLLAAHESNVSRVVFLGSSCIYPKFAQQPIPESALLTGPLEPTNSAYAMAKLSGIELVKSLRSQHGRRWISVLPSNLYGPGDNFNLESSHVVPALLRKFHEAKVRDSPHVELWGSGRPRREFLHSSDAARGIIACLVKYDDDEPINVGFGEDVTIRDLAEKVRSVVEYRGEIVWNTTKPDGVPQKLLDSSKVRALGWQPTVSLEVGLKDTYRWMIENSTDIRG